MKKDKEFRRSLIKQAQADWINTMKRDYPNFKYKQWGRNGYRIQHPQITIMK